MNLCQKLLTFKACGCILLFENMCSDVRLLKEQKSLLNSMKIVQWLHGLKDITPIAKSVDTNIVEGAIGVYI